MPLLSPTMGQGRTAVNTTADRVLSCRPESRRAACREQMVSYPQHLIGMSKWDLDTPALVLDIGLVEQNLATMAAAAGRFGKQVRPHIKTHKTPLLALRQLEGGALGVCAAKLSEVETMILGGIKEILLTTETAGPRKIARLLTLSRHAHLMNVVDDADAAAELSDAFAR